jgi:hypothetical protein
VIRAQVDHIVRGKLYWRSIPGLWITVATVVFQLAEVAVPRALFAEILRRVDQLRSKFTPLAA